MNVSLFSQSKTDHLHVCVECQDQRPMEKGGNTSVAFKHDGSSETLLLKNIL